jgi:hypothetical protein
MLLKGSIICACLLTAASALSQPSPAPDGTVLRPQVVPLTAQMLYQGWRAADVLGEGLVSRANETVGTVRNILLRKDGGIEALIVERAGSAGFPEFVYRVPWSKIARDKLPGSVTADVGNGREPQYGLFSDKAGAAVLPNEFAVTEVIGDYARLQAGQAYGYVNDVVFAADGRMLAVLVTRDAAAGGGTYAFGFPGTTGRWSPAEGYYGLPYVTAEQANAAAVRVDPARFVGEQDQRR